jgi:hypothetical protein
MCPCGEGDGFLNECDRCFRLTCEYCGRIIECMRYCWECAPVVREEIRSERIAIPGCGVAVPL